MAGTYTRPPTDPPHTHTYYPKPTQKNNNQQLEVQTFSDVFDCARRIGAYLQREMGLRPGDRAVLLYPPGQEFILAFMGCIFAGVVAVPVYPPHPYRMDTDLSRLNLIVNNSGCKVSRQSCRGLDRSAHVYVCACVCTCGLGSGHWSVLTDCSL